MPLSTSVILGTRGVTILRKAIQFGETLENKSKLRLATKSKMLFFYFGEMIVVVFRADSSFSLLYTLRSCLNDFVPIVFLIFSDHDSRTYSRCRSLYIVRGVQPICSANVVCLSLSAFKNHKNSSGDICIGEILLSNSTKRSAEDDFFCGLGELFI